MSKRIRQYIGILCAVLAYYLIHEGAHLLYALAIGAFRQIHVLGLGVQIDVWPERMAETQMGIFCLAGAAATQLTGWALTALSGGIARARSKPLRGAAYYVTLAMLVLDPLYLSALCSLFGGGDMNGISLLVPQAAARAGFGVLLAVNALLFWKIVLPRYRAGSWD